MLAKILPPLVALVAVASGAPVDVNENSAAITAPDVKIARLQSAFDVCTTSKELQAAYEVLGTCAGSVIVPDEDTRTDLRNKIKVARDEKKKAEKIGACRSCCAHNFSIPGGRARHKQMAKDTCDEKCIEEPDSCARLEHKFNPWG